MLATQTVREFTPETLRDKCRTHWCFQSGLSKRLVFLRKDTYDRDKALEWLRVHYPHSRFLEYRVVES